MKEERLWELVSLKLSGEATQEDLSELNSLLSTTPELHFKVEILETIWKTKSRPLTNSEESFNRHLQRFSNHFSGPALQYEDIKGLEESQSKPNQKTFIRIAGWLSIAAAAVLIGFFVRSIFFREQKITAFPNIVATKPGSKSKVILPDGTQVWINADSKITYDEAFGNKLREIELTGEAFFDVVKDEKRPFIIHTKTIEIKVLGTAFNVRSYPNEKAAETSLIRGIIEVTLLNNPGKKIVLKPNEKLTVQNNDKTGGNGNPETIESNEPMLVLSNIHYFKGDSSVIETSWVKNKLAFDEETLESVAKKIERWYGVEVIIKDESLKREKYSSVFEDETLPEVMSALQLTGNFKYAINKKEVVITP